MELQSVSSPANGSATSTPNETFGEPALLADLDALIAEIESAPAGNADLDARIHFGFRIATQRSPDIAALLIEHGVTWPTVEAVLDEEIPPFTTSLDAALEGEDVVFVIRSAKRRLWGAMQKSSGGEEVLAWAATEPLARRLAALRSWRLDLDKPAPASTAPADRSSQHGQPADTTTSEKDWEISF